MEKIGLCFRPDGLGDRYIQTWGRYATNYIGLGDSKVRGLGIEPLNIRKFRTRKRVVMCYPGAGIDFIKDR